MTPKEKAEDLVKKLFEFNHRVKWDSDNDEWTQDYYLAKQCALIAVDEMLDNADVIWGWDSPEKYNFRKYWQEVKQEIEKL